MTTHNIYNKFSNDLVQIDLGIERLEQLELKEIGSVYM